jgi:hypothetical protein
MKWKITVMFETTNQHWLIYIPFPDTPICGSVKIPQWMRTFEPLHAPNLALTTNQMIYYDIL